MSYDRYDVTPDPLVESVWAVNFPCKISDRLRGEDLLLLLCEMLGELHGEPDQIHQVRFLTRRILRHSNP